MSRKDTIIVAILINTGLLAVLFMMAVQTEDLGSFPSSPFEIAEVSRAYPQQDRITQMYPISTSETIKEVEPSKLDHEPSPLIHVPEQHQIIQENVQKTVVNNKASPEKYEVEPQYYTLKSGDNPWKVAKQFRVGFGELLKLNHLDEAKARNLKPGDVLRVK